MRILFFIGTICDGGAERVVSIISNKLAEKGFDIEILKYYDKKDTYYLSDKVKVTCVEKLSDTKNKILNYITIRNYFKNNGDVIISFLAPYNIYALLANVKINKPIIVADRNDPRRVPGNAVIRKLRDFLYEKYADIVVVQNKYNLSYFNSKIQNKSVIINNPLDMKKLVGKALTSKKENIIVSVGRLMPQKNQEMLIRAFSKVHIKYPKYKLVIYGDGPSKINLMNLAKNYYLEDTVLFPGNIRDVLEKEKKANIFVLSSNYEGMPNALIEAMSLGLSVISTKVSGATDVIKNNKNGILIDINDEKELEKQLIRLISNKELSTKLANEACEIYKDFDIDIVINKWIKVINKVI